MPGILRRQLGTPHHRAVFNLPLPFLPLPKSSTAQRERAAPVVYLPAEHQRRWLLVPKHREGSSGELLDKGGRQDVEPRAHTHTYALTHTHTHTPHTHTYTPQPFKTLKEEENRCFAAQTFLPQLSSTHLRLLCGTQLDPFFSMGTDWSDFS